MEFEGKGSSDALNKTGQGWERCCGDTGGGSEAERGQSERREDCCGKSASEIIVSLLPVYIAIVPAGPEGDSELPMALEHGEDEAQRFSGVEEAGGEEGWDVPWSGFPAAQICSVLPSAADTTNNWKPDFYRLWPPSGEEGTEKAGFVATLPSKNPFSLKVLYLPVPEIFSL